MYRLPQHLAIMARPASVFAAIRAERTKSARKNKIITKGTVVVCGATALVLAASATAMAAGWSAADLTAITGAPEAAGDLVGFTTSLSGQGPAARVDYRTSAGHVEELSIVSGGRWSAADLTAIAGAPAAAGDLVGFTTSLSGQGPAARVDYLTAGGHVEELSVL